MGTEKRLVFGPFYLDTENERLWRGEETVKLTFKSFAVLRYLGERLGRLVTKDELFAAVWPETVVGDVTLATCIWEIRKALEDDPRKPQFIETVHRRGYRWIAGTRDWRLETSPPAPQASSLKPQAPSFVGREAELAQLHRWLEKALSGERQMVFVTGEPGIGKTTLIETFVEQIRNEEGLWVGRGQCIAPYGAGEAYLPVLEALGRLCRTSGGEHLKVLLGHYAPTWLVQMPALLGPDELEALQRKVVGATRERMLREMAEAVEVLTSAQPLVLVLEDLHWSDYSTLELLSALARRHESARLLLIGSYRPEEVHGHGHPLRTIAQELQLHRLCQEVPLTLLNEDAVAEYMARRFSVGRHSHIPLRNVARVIYQRTEGNPLFMVNIADFLVTREVLRWIGREWEIRDDIETVQTGIPENLRQMIERQAVRLTRREQQVLEAASVAGVEFSAAAVAAGIGAEIVQVEEVCEGLGQRCQFLRARGASEWPDGTVAARYSFLHALYQEVVYEQLPAGKRAQLHRRLGERMEQGYGDRVQEIATELAVHFERGRDHRRAVQYHEQAAETAVGRSAYAEAVGHFSTGLELLKALPDTPEHLQRELVLQTRLGLTLQGYKGLAAPEAERAYTRASHLSRQVGEPLQLFHLWRGLHSVHQARGEWQRAQELATQCLNLARQLQDPALLISSHSMLGAAFASFGELIPARTHLEQGIALYDPDQHPQLPEGCPSFATYYVTFCLSLLAPILLQLGYPNQALKRNQEALALAQEQSHPYGLTWAAYRAAEFHLIRREWQLSQERAETAIGLAGKYGFMQWGIMGTILRGAAMVEQGQGEEGREQIRQGLTAYRATGAQAGRPFYLSLLAGAYWKAGQPDEGLAVLAEALLTACKYGHCLQEAGLHWLKGELVLKKETGAWRRETSLPSSQASSLRPPVSKETGREAEECFLHAIDLARRQSAKSLELRAVTSLARLLQQQGKKAEARQLLAEIYGWFTEGFDTKDLQEAKALLQELA